MVNSELNEALESLILLRMRVLKNDPKNATLRASFREISGHLENIQQQKPVAFDDFRILTSWLSIFLDAEFGIRLSRYAELSECERKALAEHINERKHLVLQAEQCIPQLHITLKTCLAALNQSSDTKDNLGKLARLLTRVLKKHLQDDEKFRGALNALIAAMQESLESISGMLSDIGEDSPELAETQALLEQELPDDPKAAKAILQSARRSILKAGQRVSKAGHNIQQTMEKQETQMQKMSADMNRAKFEAQHDTLTGLGNRRQLADFIEILGDKTAAFLMLDIDHFKRINDRHGHDAGDDVLTALGKILSENVRSTDLAVRLGGEEFGIVLPNISPEKAFNVAETLRLAISASKIKYRKGKIPVTASIGLAMRKPNERISDWLSRSDKYLYEAKNNGRNQTKTSSG